VDMLSVHLVCTFVCMHAKRKHVELVLPQILSAALFPKVSFIFSFCSFFINMIDLNLKGQDMIMRGIVYAKMLNPKRIVYASPKTLH